MLLRRSSAMPGRFGAYAVIAHVPVEPAHGAHDDVDCSAFCPDLSELKGAVHERTGLVGLEPAPVDDAVDFGLLGLDLGRGEVHLA